MAHDPNDDPDHEDQRNRVLLAYVEALEQGCEPDRAQLLAAHPDLRPDLEAFLNGHDEVARLTAPHRAARRSDAHSPIGTSRETPEDPPAGLGELGDFRLLREVGRGGMGVVYEAEQISLRRRVALKVLPFAAAIDSRRLQRFKTEALAAAHVQHEKIVPVHAVGCERGVHYYAMQFIDGQSLAALIGELRGLREEQRDRADITEAAPACAEGQPRGAATSAATTISRERSADRRRYFERVAGLGRQAALALEHAHQAGIVHRDVKPGNLLLDLRGQLWVTDFGLAQVTGDTGLTITGEMLGTLRYASPEQALARRGIVDHRSDIYSLGATLYELLTLRPPFDGHDRNTLIRQIADEEPASPRSLEPSIPAELETIVLKALRKEPADRYAAAQEMADDLQRFLDGRPILARPPTATERLRAWSRRHPSFVRAGAVALIFLSAASLVSTALVRREQGKTLVEQRRAESAYLRERQRAEEAEARFRLARRAVDELIRVSEEELAHRPGMEGLRKRLLASALTYYREFIDQRRSDPDAQAELRDTTRRVETILADLAVLRAAGELYLLVQPTALDDLRLDEGQRAKVAELSARAGKRWMETFGNPSRLPPPARRVKLALEQARANEAEVDAILTPPQRLRLRQLALQSEGVGAFREPDVVEALGLAPEQRERIRAIEEEILFGQLREMQSGKAPEGAGKPGSSEAIDRILSILSVEQARRWREMAGEPIRGPLSAFPTRFGTQRDPRRAPR
ncbi:MAG: serine/threonine-protein kinase [Isosphaeraceae bacterium]|nr:serine/threonine-protein kinase [Isosphaeraceae bacterium]